VANLVLGLRHTEHPELIEKVDLELFASEREAEFGDLRPSLQLIKVSPALSSILPGYSDVLYSFRCGTRLRRRKTLARYCLSVAEVADEAKTDPIH
jgi:hypothetical protein